MKTNIRYNKTKIIATIGPATSSYEMLKKLIKAGVDVCRINFSHGSHDDHRKVVERVNRINEELGTYVCLLGDLQGPKLRIGEVENNQIELEKGNELILTTEKCIGTAKKLYISYKALPKDVKKGEAVLLDDGKIELKIVQTLDSHNILAKVVHGGYLSSKKGFNLPDTQVSQPSLTEKDLLDLDFALEMDLDWIGLSFVRHPDDVRELKHIIHKKGSRAKVIAKIEKPQAIKHIDAIIAETDGIMVARGDLGVELPMEKVPMIQKRIVDKCIIASKPVIIATQMMESMIENPTPTRAETNDVANAVMDGADAVMLSAETSVGKYPINTVEAMEKILGVTEIEWDVYYKGKKPNHSSPSFLSDEICFTAVRMSDHIGAKAIVSMTQTGYTAYKIASFRPKCDVFIFTSNKDIMRTLSLVWNVRVFYYDSMMSTDESMKDVLLFLKERKLLKRDDLVVHTASMPISAKAKTNTLKISKVD
jgi:pyruvate kinase